jgi:hypothetical protein
MLRDKLKDNKYYDDAIQHSNEFIAEEIEYLNDDSVRPLSAMKTNTGLCSDLIEKLVYCYSRGDVLSNLKKDLIGILKHKKMQLYYAELLPKEESKNRVEWEKLSFTNYKGTLTWLAFAVSTGANPDYFKNLFELVDNKGLDALFDRIAVKLGDTARPVATNVLYAKPYQLLLDAVDAEGNQQATLMNKFMDVWYPACVKNGFYETHNITNNFGYSGYWCFEAALVTLVFKLDDSGYRNHKYYPAALVHGD